MVVENLCQPEAETASYIRHIAYTIRKQKVVVKVLQQKSTVVD